MNKYNNIEWDNMIWNFFGIDDDIRNAWDNRFGEENVSIALINTREYLKKHPNYEEEIIIPYCGGNWSFWLWDVFEREEGWRKENESSE